MKKKQRFCSIGFNVQGYIEQTLEILDPKLSGEDIVKLLREGKAATTIQEDGEVVLHDTMILKNSAVTFKVIARVDSINNNLEYEEYETTDFDGRE